MDESRKKTLAVCAAFIAAPRLLFLDEETPAALREALNDAIRKAEILRSRVDALADQSSSCQELIAVSFRAANLPAVATVLINPFAAFVTP
jgi:ABC-type molybdenum transport system ATPase subunit/photorepair protein PhrA